MEKTLGIDLSLCQAETNRQIVEKTGYDVVEQARQLAFAGLMGPRLRSESWISLPIEEQQRLWAEATALAEEDARLVGEQISTSPLFDLDKLFSEAIYPPEGSKKLSSLMFSQWPGPDYLTEQEFYDKQFTNFDVRQEAIIKLARANLRLVDEKIRDDYYIPEKQGYSLLEGDFNIGYDRFLGLEVGSLLVYLGVTPVENVQATLTRLSNRAQNKLDKNQEPLITNLLTNVSGVSGWVEIPRGYIGSEYRVGVSFNKEAMKRAQACSVRLPSLYRQDLPDQYFRQSRYPYALRAYDQYRANLLAI
jgi:hypothetical protein